MWAIMRDGVPWAVLPDLDTAKTYYGSLSLNGSKHKWKIKQVEVRFPHETPAERHTRLCRHVQAVVDLNKPTRGG